MTFVLAMVALRWDPATGFTRLLYFGGPKWEDRLPALRALPVARDSGTGYDGQWGAQLAVDPHPSDPAILRALDNPPYRSRRMLLAWTAHLLGGGRPWWTLQVFALQNLVLWLVLAAFVAAEVRPAADPAAAALWAGCLLTVGSLDSVRQSLTELAALVLLAAAVRRARGGRPGAAAALLGLAGLARETALLGLPLLLPSPRVHGARWIRPVLGGALAALPLALWAGWLAVTLPVPAASGLGVRNFDWPGLGLGRHLATCFNHLAAGDFDSRYLAGLPASLGLAAQSLWLLSHPRWGELWWRAAAGFALLFWVLGDNVWHGYWAAARALLPMTVAFNLLLPRARGFWPWLVLTNVALVAHGLWRMLP